MDARVEGTGGVQLTLLSRKERGRGAKKARQETFLTSFSSTLSQGTRLSRRAFKEVSGYVRQADYLNAEDTVAEAVGFSAFLRSSGDAETRAELVSRTLEALGLTHCADQRIAALSGGERRRVSVALQLVTSPKVIFLDEPTSGLDADNALRLCQALRHMADTSGVAVVMTIHQPSDEIFHVSVTFFAESLRT